MSKQYEVFEFYNPPLCKRKRWEKIEYVGFKCNASEAVNYSHIDNVINLMEES